MMAPTPAKIDPTSICRWLPALLLLGMAGCINLNLDVELSSRFDYRDGTPGGVIRARGTGRQSVDLTLYHVSDAERFLLEQPNIFTPGSCAVGEMTRCVIETGDRERFHPVARWKQELQLGPGIREFPLTLPTLAHGLYVVEARAGSMRSTVPMIANDMIVIIKRSGAELLAMALDRGSGRRLPGSSITVSAGPGEALSATTGVDGTAKLDLSESLRKSRAEWPALGKHSVDSLHRFLAIIGSRDSALAVGAIWIPRAERPVDDTVIDLRVDSTTYRSTLVRYKGTVTRRLANGDLAPLPAHPVLLRIVRVPGDATIVDDTVVTLTDGPFERVIDLSSDGPAAQGLYTITSGATRLTDTVQFGISFRPRENLRVEARMDSSVYHMKSRQRIEIRAVDSLRKPAAGAPVYINVYGRPMKTQQELPAVVAPGLRHGFDVPWEGAIYSNDLRGVLDSNGVGSLEFPSPGSHGTRELEYRIVITVNDGRRGYGTATTEYRIVPEAIAITQRTDRRIYYSGEKGELRIRIERGGHGAAIPFVATMQHNMIGYRGEFISDTAWAFHGVTDSSGHASVPFVAPRAAYWSLCVQAVGTRDTSWRPVFVVRRDSVPYFPFSPGNRRIAVLSDRDYYSPGDTMRLLVSDIPNGSDLLITLEGRGIYLHRVERSMEPTTLHTVVVEKRFASRLTISVAGVMHGRAVADSVVVGIMVDTKDPARHPLYRWWFNTVRDFSTFPEPFLLPRSREESNPLLGNRR